MSSTCLESPLPQYTAEVPISHRILSTITNDGGVFNHRHQKRGNLIRSSTSSDSEVAQAASPLDITLR